MPLHLFRWKFYAVYFPGLIQYDKPVSRTMDCNCVLVISGVSVVFCEAQPASYAPQARTSFLRGKTLRVKPVPPTPHFRGDLCFDIWGCYSRADSSHVLGRDVMYMAYRYHCFIGM